ncbi:pseudouridine synthase [Hellea sp.]|nr:pseudouridine synthase [Hellea sp.]
MTPREFTYAPPQNPLTYLYTDDVIIIIEKPSGLLSVPGKTEPDCLEARLREKFPEALTIHRLDMATSGVMVFARNANAQRHIGLQFEKRMTEKTYLAQVWGKPKKDQGTINLPLITDWPNRPKQMVCHERGKASLTEWKVIERDEISTRLELYPKTGRSHQLRVHMLEIGHSILGDRLYAHDEAFHAAPRLQLHAHKLKLRKPTGGDWIEFESPAPF